jgi:hypothetical protein
MFARGMSVDRFFTELYPVSFIFDNDFNHCGLNACAELHRSICERALRICELRHGDNIKLDEIKDNSVQSRIQIQENAWIHPHDHGVTLAGKRSARYRGQAFSFESGEFPSLE